MVKNGLSIDVEDYYQVAAFFDQVEYGDWENWASRVEQNTHRILDLMDEKNCKATFFTLGWVAERYPNIVREIVARGHELASHGYSHQLIYKQAPEVFKQETLKSKALLEDIGQVEVQGYRAASYSITQDSIWALDILAEAGFIYDSSIFPIHHDRYGMPNVPGKPHQAKTKSNILVELPLSTVPLLGQKLPVSGGGYFRLYPFWLTKYLLHSFSKHNDYPFIFYLHPWEVDPEQPRIQSSWFSMFRHYNNLDKCYARLSCLLDSFDFTTMQDAFAASLAEPSRLDTVNYQ